MPFVSYGYWLRETPVSLAARASGRVAGERSLRGIGFRLHDRFKLGQAAALDIQRSLIGAGGKVHRFLSIAPADLATRIAALGDDVRFVHASYTGDRVVTDEPLATAAAILNSQPKGYFVSPIVVTRGGADDWLVERWLTGAAVGPGG